MPLLKVGLIGGTGSIGVHVMEHLSRMVESNSHNAPSEIRVLTRTPQEHPSRAGVKYVFGEIDNYDSVKAAFESHYVSFREMNNTEYHISRLFVCLPQSYSSDEMIRVGKMIGDVAKELKITMIVRISSMGIDNNARDHLGLPRVYDDLTQGPLGDAHKTIEDYYDSLGIECVSIRPTSFFSNFLKFDLPVLEPLVSQLTECKESIMTLQREEYNNCTRHDVLYDVYRQPFDYHVYRRVMEDSSLFDALTDELQALYRKIPSLSIASPLGTGAKALVNWVSNEDVGAVAAIALMGIRYRAPHMSLYNDANKERYANPFRNDNNGKLFVVEVTGSRENTLSGPGMASMIATIVKWHVSYHETPLPSAIEYRHLWTFLREGGFNHANSTIEAACERSAQSIEQFLKKQFRKIVDPTFDERLCRLDDLCCIM